jgi:hypothetical protein
MNDLCQEIDNQMNKKSLISPNGQWSIVNSFYINAIISKKVVSLQVVSVVLQTTAFDEDPFKLYR